VWDASGREYLDTIMALGAVALGYAHPSVVEAVERAARAGAVGSLAPVLEADVAEQLCAILPGGEAVRFFKTGAEAVAAAVRVSRVVTGRDRVLSCGYHGWLDWCQDGPGVPAAVRGLRQEIEFNNLASLRGAFESGADVAAIVIEPVIDGPPTMEWLRAVREQATARGAVLVFDEIKTAFRIAVGGAAERWGVVPDLLVVGKALGNGLPIAAVCGDRNVMDGFNRTWVSSTLATEFVSLAAAEAVLRLFTGEPVVAHLERAGTAFLAGLQRLAERHSALVVGVRGVPQMCHVEFASDRISQLVARGAADRGLLFKRSAYNFISLAHTLEDVDDVLHRLNESLQEVEQRC
jgi:glutamate-1-semialdehyde aminotransferase